MGLLAPQRSLDKRPWGICIRYGTFEKFAKLRPQPSPWMGMLAIEFTLCCLFACFFIVCFDEYFRQSVLGRRESRENSFSNYRVWITSWLQTRHDRRSYRASENPLRDCHRIVALCIAFLNVLDCKTLRQTTTMVHLSQFCWKFHQPCDFFSAMRYFCVDLP